MSKKIKRTNTIKKQIREMKKRLKNIDINEIFDILNNGIKEEDDHYVRPDLVKPAFILNKIIKLCRLDPKLIIDIDVLLNDEYGWVRQRVAQQGYGLEILVNDEDEDVRRAVYTKILETLEYVLYGGEEQ